MRVVNLTMQMPLTKLNRRKRFMYPTSNFWDKENVDVDIEGEPKEQTVN